MLYYTILPKRTHILYSIITPFSFETQAYTQGNYIWTKKVPNHQTANSAVNHLSTHQSLHGSFIKNSFQIDFYIIFTLNVILNSLNLKVAKLTFCWTSFIFPYIVKN